ncbi:MAG TPA: amidohydrolase family protein [Xanthobacteraceae bacterium]|nr:amidohydrolase family protein [Xanthobacteraceae bacterium]
MLIDWHTHIHSPANQAKPYWQGRCPMTLENVLAAHALAGLDKSVISNAGHFLRFCKTVAETVAGLEDSNRYLAKCRDQHPDKLVAMATCVPGGGDECLKELERAVREDDCRAVLIGASHQGQYPDADAAKPFFKLVTDLDIPVFVHPGDSTTPATADYRLASSISRPADNCLSLARLIVRGIFEDFPTLKLVGSHLGGGICEVIGRMDYAYTLGDFAFFLGPYDPVLIKHPPSHYLRMMYLESTSYTPLAAAMCLRSVGADHFIFGTDSPPLIPLKRQGLEMMDKIGMTAGEREKVTGGNAARLLKLSS